MIYLCILFLPPVYFLARKKWGGFCLNAFLYGLAWLCLISVVGVMAAPFFWLLSVGHASFTHRNERLERHAELLASKIKQSK